MVATTTYIPQLYPRQYAAVFRPSQVELPMKIDLPSIEEFIEWRIARLTRLGVASKNDLLRLAAHVTDRNFGFFPEWPDPLDFSRWMAMIDHPYGRRGLNRLHTPGFVTDVIAIPAGPCIGLDIDDGWSRRNMRPTTSRQEIVSAGRVPFTARMGVSFVGDNPDAINDLGLDLAGSEYSVNGLPVVALHNKRPVLFDWWDIRAKSGGVPSCGRVVGL